MACIGKETTSWKNRQKLTSLQSIESAATQSISKTDPTSTRDLRKPTIFSDAILAMLRAPTKVVNGLIDTDEDFLRSFQGITDFSKYSVVPGSQPRRIMPVNFPDLNVAEQYVLSLSHVIFL